VDYPDDDDDEVMDAKSETIVADKQEIELPERGLVDTNTSPTTSSTSQNPPERLSEKRRRVEDDEDELGRLAQNGSKRRSSSASSTASMYFRRRQNSIDRNLKNSANNEVSNSTANAAPKKIAINLSSALKSHVTVEAEAIQLSEFDEQASNGDEPKETNEGENATQSS
jgi:protein phosphatase-4 regulatory subunit 3